jgi:DNA modification methylase
MNDINSSKLQTTTETPIVAIPCYAQPFYSFKDVQIFNENCLDTMGRMPDNYIDLTVTSPPYDNLRDYKGYSFPFEDIARELYRVTKPGGVVVWVVCDSTVNGSESLTSFKQALYFNEIGFNVHDTMIYKAEKQPLSHNRYEQKFEYMFVFGKGKIKTFNPITEKSVAAGQKRTSTLRQDGDELGSRSAKGNVKEVKIKGNVWEYSIGNNGSSNDEIAFKHPAIFPEKLAADHIYSWSNEGDLIYDCFGGSGTTVKMAHLQNRKAIMSEISKEYCEIAKKRIDPYLRQERLF